MCLNAGMNQRNQVRQPDSCGESLAGNVPNHYAQRRAKFHHLEEVAGKMAHRKYLTGNVEFAGVELTRSAKPALNLRRFKKAPVELRLLAAQYGQLLFERTDVCQVSVRGGIHLRLGKFTYKRSAWRRVLWACPLPHIPIRR